MKAEGRGLVTADKGFGDVRTYVPGTYVGVILLRAAVESRRRYLELAEATVRSVRLEDLAGCLVVVTPRGDSHPSAFVRRTRGSESQGMLGGQSGCATRCLSPVTHVCEAWSMAPHPPLPKGPLVLIPPKILKPPRGQF